MLRPNWEKRNKGNGSSISTGTPVLCVVQYFRPLLEVPAPSSTLPVSQRQVKDLIAPLLPGWLVPYRDPTGKLCGGADDRAHETVRECHWEEGRWTVCLTDGQRVPLSIIRAVASTHPDGRIRAAWTMREHGYDGHGSSTG